jgi:hypothetical protein
MGPVLAALILASTVQTNGSDSPSAASHPQLNTVQFELEATPTKGHPQLQHKGRGKNIKDNATTIAAIVAAIITIVSFVFNYRATIRNQQDTQFYEALKRFGDNDSPSVRFSAAGFLSVMAAILQQHFSNLTPGKAFEENSVVFERLGENLTDLHRQQSYLVSRGTPWSKQ